MRLINCRTYRLEEFLGSKIPKYAILSHTWGEQEVSFAEFTTNQATARLKEGFRKIEFTCKQALAEGRDYAWVDTVCIDKSSSAELSEAINSMFKWYQRSSICYAYLSDVTIDNFDEEFPQSRWFRRGWTLQELLAPPLVDFFDSMWHDLGNKAEHAYSIYDITRIDVEALIGGRRHEDFSEAGLGAFCVAKRMAWASQRETTRVEDVAYCLLGLFDVNMPLLYGEGENAFLRLQQEIIKNLDDDSILAWGLTEDKADADMPHCVVRSIDGSYSTSTILASSPKDFSNCHDLQYAAESISPFMVTNQGLQMELPLIRIQTPSDGRRYAPEHPAGWVGLLTCSTLEDSRLLGIILVPSDYSPMRVKRVVVNQWSNTYTAARTVFVGPRVVAQAVQTKINILEHNESLSVRNYFFGHRQILVNHSLGSIGYDVTAAKGLNILRIRWAYSYYSHWDPKTATLRVPGRRTVDDLIIINFQAAGDNLNKSLYPSFSILLRGRIAMARRGLSFSNDEQHVLFAFLEDRGQDLNEEEGLVLRSYNGRQLKIFVTTREKIVHHWKIIELFVNAIEATELSASDSDQE